MCEKGMDHAAWGPGRYACRVLVKSRHRGTPLESTTKRRCLNIPTPEQGGHSRKVAVCEPSPNRWCPPRKKGLMEFACHYKTAWAFSFCTGLPKVVFLWFSFLKPKMAYLQKEGQAYNWYSCTRARFTYGGCTTSWLHPRTHVIDGRTYSPRGCDGVRVHLPGLPGVQGMARSSNGKLGAVPGQTQW